MKPVTLTLEGKSLLSSYCRCTLYHSAMQLGWSCQFPNFQGNERRNWTPCLISWLLFCDDFRSHLSQSTGGNLLIFCVQYYCFNESMVKEDRGQCSWALSPDIEKEKNCLCIQISSCSRSCTNNWFQQLLNPKIDGI